MDSLLDIRNEVSACLMRVHLMYMASEGILKEDREQGDALCFALEELRQSLHVVKDGLAAIQEARS